MKLPQGVAEFQHNKRRRYVTEISGLDWHAFLQQDVWTDESEGDQEAHSIGALEQYFLINLEL
jgi:hypothetical protein